MFFHVGHGQASLQPYEYFQRYQPHFQVDQSARLAFAAVEVSVCPLVYSIAVVENHTLDFPWRKLQIVFAIW